MQNIDSLYLLQPIVTIAFSSGLIIYWYLRRRFTIAVLLCSLTAYAGAIACKVVLQALTFNTLLAGFRGNLSILGVYFGIQTVFFEVGGAYLVALWGVSKGKLNFKDSEAYGLGLAFWEPRFVQSSCNLLDSRFGWRDFTRIVFELDQQ